MAKSLSDQAGFLIVANLVKYAVGFIMPMVLVRLLSQSDYGSYQQLILIGTAVTGVLTLGLPTSIYYFYHHVGPRKRPALIMQTTLLLVVAGAAATLATWFSADELSTRLNNPTASGLLQIYALSLFFTIASEHCLHVMIAQNRYGLAVGLEIGETVVRVLTLLAPLYWGYGISGLIIGIVVYSALRFFVRNVYLLNRSDVGFAGWKKQSFVSEQMAYSIPVALVTLSSLIGSTLNRGMLAATFTPAHYAIYAVGALEIPLDVIFQASVANVLRARLPSLVQEGNLEEIARIMREAVRKLSMIVIPSFVFLLGHSHEFITLLFTSHYEESVHVFRIYLWLIPLHMLVLSPIPQAFGKPKFNLYIVVTMNVLLLVLGYILLKFVGFYGPALAAVITQYIQSAVFFFIVRRLTKASLHQLLSIQHMLRVTAAALISLAASYFIGQFMSAGLIHLAFSGVAFSIVFFMVAALLRVFSDDDINLLRRWAGKLIPFKLA
ncbi:MAG TPA: oligosaccharide flippase family protein [Burkholderiaceae bacterium]|nr:oligosaccharide flippase family protein [Burkholderiaceae bacterium]